MGGFVGPIDDSNPDAISNILAGNPELTANDLLPNLGFNTTGFDLNANPTDPNNTGDTGGLQNVSTPGIAGNNNPESGGISSWGGVVGSAISAAFGAWNLAQQPRGTPRQIVTQVGGTRVTSGPTSGLSHTLGLTGNNQSNLIMIIGIVLIGVIVLRYVRH